MSIKILGFYKVKTTVSNLTDILSISDNLHFYAKLVDDLVLVFPDYTVNVSSVPFAISLKGGKIEVNVFDTPGDYLSIKVASILSKTEFIRDMSISNVIDLPDYFSKCLLKIYYFILHTL